tara:strand:- start:10176 stop:10373 length:198 start_codon:yes stop_codon:yes gene_type:complete
MNKPEPDAQYWCVYDRQTGDYLGTIRVDGHSEMSIDAWERAAYDDAFRDWPDHDIGVDLRAELSE